MTENKRIDIILQDEGGVVELDGLEPPAQLDDSIPFLQPLKKCGEVFMESAGELIFVCTLCSEHFNNLQIFGMHLYDMHIHNEEPEENHQAEPVVSVELPGVAESYQVNDKDVSSTGELQNMSSDDANLSTVDLSGLEECDMYAQSSFADDVPFDDSSHLSSLNEGFPANLCDVQHDLPSEIQLTYVCKQCGVHFIDDPSLQKHIKSAHPLIKVLECPYCDKTFSKPVAQQSHINMHTGHRPYTCKYCPRGFTMKSSLRVHTKTHFEAPAFSCTVCGKLFHQNYERKRHEATHVKDRKFKCDECGKMFLSHRYLLPHVRRHEAAGLHDKLYECDICEENHTLVNLFWHKREHARSKSQTDTSITLG